MIKRKEVLFRDLPTCLFNNWICKQNAYAWLHSTHLCHFISHYISEKLLKVSVIPSVPFSSHSLFQQVHYRKFCYMSCNFWWMALTYKWAATLSAKNIENNVQKIENNGRSCWPLLNTWHKAQLVFVSWWVRIILPFFSFTNNNPTVLVCKLSVYLN